jgi:membrane protein YqaA with SNARE-associated domain
MPSRPVATVSPSSWLPSNEDAAPASDGSARACVRLVFAAMNETQSLWAVFGSSFLGATLLPGGSEAVLFGMLKYQPQLYWLALAAATLGNTLGGMTSYAIGRFLPQRKALKGVERVRRYGSPVLLLSWVPIIGDPLCVAAGWLRLGPWRSAFMAAGKFARYLVVAAAAA